MCDCARKRCQEGGGGPGRSLSERYLCGWFLRRHCSEAGVEARELGKEMYGKVILWIGIFKKDLFRRRGLRIRFEEIVIENVRNPPPFYTPGGSSNYSRQKSQQ